jgi:hypothetical protein
MPDGTPAASPLSPFLQVQPHLAGPICAGARAPRGAGQAGRRLAAGHHASRAGRGARRMSPPREAHRGRRALRDRQDTGEPLRL